MNGFEGTGNTPNRLNWPVVVPLSMSLVACIDSSPEAHSGDGDKANLVLVWHIHL